MKVQTERRTMFDTRKRVFTAYGRNKFMHCIGLTEWKDSKGIIFINPVTSKGSTSTACTIQVPAESWYGEALDAILEKKELLPLLVGLHPLLDSLVANKLKETK